MNINKKIILGTAQFGSNYGISNTTGDLHLDQAREIINYASSVSIDCIDTAMDYSQSQTILSKINISNMNVISKIPYFHGTDQKSLKEMKKTILDSIINLGINTYDTLLLHRPEQLLSGDKEKILNFLDLLKNEKITKKVGISIYSPNILSEILDLYPFDIIQAPINILDQRVIQAKHIDKIKRKNIVLHARSIFLQGLLLMSQNLIPSKFKKFKNIFQEWDDWLNQNSLSPLEACIKFLYQTVHVDNIIVGVQNDSQLKEIMKVKKSKLESLPKWPNEIDEMILNPNEWN